MKICSYPNLFLLLTCAFQFSNALESHEENKYNPPQYPKSIDFLHQVCNCPSMSDSSTYNKIIMDDVINICGEYVNKLSKRTYDWVMNKSAGKWQFINDCKRSEEAFQQSILLPDKNELLKNFMRKMNHCEGETVSIVIFGGSVTAGTICPNKLHDNIHVIDPIATPFLDLPDNITLPLVRGDGMCPWANQLYTFLHESYPSCQHIDIYNLAHHSTDHLWLLSHINESFYQGNGARGGKRLVDVVDLILVDYAVNDGTTYAPMLGTLGLQSTENNALLRMEVLVEYAIEYMLKLPTLPGLIYLESGSPESNVDATRAHYNAARRFGIPMVSARHVLSYPDDPTFVYFRNHNHHDITSDQVQSSKFGIFTDYKEIRKHPNMDYVKNPVMEGDRTIDYSGKTRDHKFIACWMGIHPKHSAHTVLAQSVFYYLQTVPKANARMTLSKCAQLYHNNITNISKHVRKSTYAEKFNENLNPLAQCPFGALISWNSEELYLKKNTIDNLVSNNINVDSEWKLLSDRPNKYGFIIEKSTGDPFKDTIHFDLLISSKPQITLEYMHSYENSGKILITLTEEGKKPSQHINKTDSEFRTSFTGVIFPRSYVVIDSYVPTVHHSLYTSFKLNPTSFKSGKVTLSIRLLEGSDQEMKQRKGNRFKLVGVNSC